MYWAYRVGYMRAWLAPAFETRRVFAFIKRVHIKKNSIYSAIFFSLYKSPLINTFGTKYNYFYFFFLLWRCDPTRVMASSFLMFLDHTQRRTTVGRTLLDGWSARRRDLYLITHNTHNSQISMPPVGFEPTISAGEWPQTYALDRAAIGTGKKYYVSL